MIIQKGSCILDVDVTKTKAYYESNTLCNCDEDRNFYAQVRDRFPKLTALLNEFGISVDRPDEISSIVLVDEIDYLFAAYSVVGRIVAPEQYEIELLDGNSILNVVISNQYFPNEQNTREYFTVAVYNIKLPWVLEEQFPEQEKKQWSILSKLKNLFFLRW